MEAVGYPDKLKMLKTCQACTFGVTGRWFESCIYLFVLLTTCHSVAFGSFKKIKRGENENRALLIICDTNKM